MQSTAAPSLSHTLAALGATYGLRAPESAMTLEAIASRRLGTAAECLPLVVNHHTWFLRDRGQLESLLDALPVGRTAHVWCAGCSSGEEPYSLALLAHGRGRDVRVVGSDVAPRVVEHARAARYAPLALRHVGEELREAFFTARDGHFEPVSRIRERVCFVEHNLMGPALVAPTPGGLWDAIVCRNVLIHWLPSPGRELVTRLRGALRDESALYLGAADSLLVPVHASPPAPPPRRVPVERSPRAARPLTPRPSPRSALDALDRGNAFARARDHDAALHAYADAAHRGGPAIAAEARLLAGIALRRSDEHEAALLALREAAFLAPHMWHAWWALAALYAGLGLSARSAAASERAHAILLHGAPMALASDVSGLAGLDLSAEHAMAWLQERGTRADASTRRG